MKIERITGSLVELLLNQEDLKKATKYLSPDMVIKASRRTFKGKVHKQGGIQEFVVTVGAPNYNERHFLDKAMSAGEKFPIKKVQVRYMPNK